MMDTGLSWSINYTICEGCLEGIGEIETSWGNNFLLSKFYDSTNLQVIKVVLTNFNTNPVVVITMGTNNAEMCKKNSELDAATNVRSISCIITSALVEAAELHGTDNVVFVKVLH